MLRCRETRPLDRITSRAGGVLRGVLKTSQNPSTATLSEPGAAAVYRFGAFVVVLSSRTLLKNGERLFLTPKAFDTLAVLLEHAGQVVDKQTLMARVWPDAHVEEGNLSQNVFVLRKLLGENARDHRFIATVPGRGYCFVGQLERNGRDDRIVDEAAATPAPLDEPQPGASIRRPRSSRPSWRLRRWQVATVGTVVLVAVAGSFMLARLGASRGVVPSPSGHAPNRAAYEAYLKGRYFWNKRTIPDIDRSVSFFQDAIRQDPKYALAYAGLADSYSFTRSEVEARVAARQALAIDPTLAGPHATLGMMALFGDWNWEEGGRELRTAVALDDSYPTAHHWYAYYCATAGRMDEAIHEMQRAAELDPLSLIIATDLGHMFYLGRQYDNAIAQFRRVIEMDRGFVMAHWHLAETLQKRADWQKAADEFRLTGVPMALQVGDALLDRRHAAERLRGLSEVDPTWHVYFLAQSIATVGGREGALAELEEARSRHEPEMLFVAADPAFDILRDNQKFQELVRGLGLRP
jgi:DNA-binding winged helix-turn-helix (wHTH) protein/Tfp pilus assembly protein PilF